MEENESIEHAIGEVSKSVQQLSEELQKFQQAAEAGLIDNPDDDPPDVAEVGLYG